MSKGSYDRHHILPRSRCKELGIDPNFEGNTVRVKTNRHRAWHLLFGNKTPDEAIAAIRDEWSLSQAGEAEFKRRTNIRLFRRKQR